MAEDDVLYLGEWLIHKKIKPAELSRKTGIGASHISLVIDRKRGLSRKAQMRIAAILDIAYWQLYTHPTAPPDTIIVKDLSPEEKQATESVVKSFRSKKKSD